MIGKVMFGVLGNDIGAVLRVSPGAYEAVLSHGRAELVDSGPRHAEARAFVDDDAVALENAEAGHAIAVCDPFFDLDGATEAADFLGED